MTTTAPVSPQVKSSFVEYEQALRDWLKFPLSKSIRPSVGDAERLGSEIWAIVRCQPFAGRLQGNYVVHGFDSSGRAVSGALKHEDSQTMEDIESDWGSGVTPTLIAEEPSGVTDCEKTVRNARSPIDDRAAALREWMARDADPASGFIADELCLEHLPDDWRDALVFAAEDACFSTPDLRRRVCGALRRVALELRSSSRSGIEQVVWSAVRRFGTLVEPESLGQLQEFLTSGTYVDTRLVALQMVTRVFEQSPPDNPELLRGLCDRTFELATKFLDPDVFASGDISAIASQAVVVLCVCADGRAVRCIGHARALGRRWFLRKLRGALEDLREGWAGRSPSCHSSVVCVEQALAAIQ